MDQTDAKLLGRLQAGLPLTAEPWRLVGRELSLPEDDVLSRVRALRAAGVIRRIGGVFEAARLGYRQTLLAMAVEPETLDHSAGLVAEHPGVSHCYGRNDEFNLWATLAVSPGSTLGLEKTVELLARQAGAKAHLNLPSRRRFKLAVRFGGGSNEIPCCVKNSRGANHRDAQNVISLSDEQRWAVRALLIDLPATPRPFDELARREGLHSGEDVLVHAADFQAAGILRRYGAVVNHVTLGVKANVMVVWRVPEAQAESAGLSAAQHQAVSHCYLRETAPGWPYNLYTMLHGSSREEGSRAIQQIAAKIGEPERRELWTTAEYKKAPVQFFCDAEAEWEKK
ncbi:MAG: Lrp/AsnC family transcriptional regulator [Phycisphaerae bacterium]|nr:Lrp/AsnC family transcriptional regulator [Phycisphaerae bacterium]